MKARLIAAFLSLLLAVSPLAFAQQAPTAKGASGQSPAQVESPAAATAAAAGGVSPAGLVAIGIAAAVAIYALASVNGSDDVIPATATSTGTR